MHATCLPKCDESYLLYWVLVQLKRELPKLSEAAKSNHPNHTFDQLALCVQMTVDRPVSIVTYPLVQVPASIQFFRLGEESAHERHFQNLTIQRNARGEKDATMLMIRRSDGQSTGTDTKIYVVSLDKSAAADYSRRRQRSAGQMSAVRSHVLSDTIIEHIQTKARDLDLNIWKAKFICKCVDRYLKSQD